MMIREGLLHNRERLLSPLGITDGFRSCAATDRRPESGIEMTAEERTRCSFIGQTGRDASAANSDRLEKGKTFYGLKNNLITYETRSLFETRKRT